MLIMEEGGGEKVTYLKTQLFASGLRVSHLTNISLTPACLTKNPGQTDEQHDTPDVQHASHL